MLRLAVAVVYNNDEKYYNKLEIYIFIIYYMYVY